MRRGNAPSMTVEQYKRLLEWEQARRSLPTLKQLARELDLPMTTVQSVLYKRHRVNLNEMLARESQ
jgi:hypothetical protein